MACHDDLNNPEFLNNLENKVSEPELMDALRQEMNQILEAMGSATRISESAASAGAMIETFRYAWEVEARRAKEDSAAAQRMADVIRDSMIRYKARMSSSPDRPIAVRGLNNEINRALNNATVSEAVAGSAKANANLLDLFGRMVGGAAVVWDASVKANQGGASKGVAAGIAGAIALGAGILGGAFVAGLGAPIALAAIGFAGAAAFSYGVGKFSEYAINEIFDATGLDDIIDESSNYWGDYFYDKLNDSSKCSNRRGVADQYDSAKNWLRRSDPLVLDLDGDGIELVAADGTVLFDHDGNRVAEATGWVAPDDGFLVIDKNGNGLIDDGSELFGDGNPDAFHDPEVQNTLSAGIRALRRYDSNQDGVFDAADAAFGQVRVWRDLNQDGVSQANELFTLADVGIQSINLNPVSTADADVGHGNVADSTGQFTRTDGSHGNFYDMLLANNPFYRQFKDEVELTETARGLLDIHGSGAVRDLREAASLDETLAAMVTGLAPGISRGDMLTQVDNILRRWANTSHMQDTETWLRETQGLNGSFRVVSGGTDRTDLTEMLSVLERFNGSRFFAEQVGGGLWASGITFTPFISEFNGETLLNYEITLPEENSNLLQQSYLALKNIVYGHLARDTRLEDYINDFEINFGMEGLQIDTSKALLRLQNRYATEPDKALEDAADLLRHASGMMGISTLQILQQIDEWVQQLSETELGRNLLVRSGFYGNNGKTTLRATENIALGGNGADAITGHEGTDIVLSGSGDDYIQAGDGNDIASGGSGNDSLHGKNGNDILLGGHGDDTLHGEDGNDTLHGGSGNDLLKGGSGNDHLDGGMGNDILEGGYGNNTYLFGRGDGMDAIVDNDATTGNRDTLIFKSGITPDDIRVIRSWDSLILKINGTSDQIRIENYFINDGRNDWQVEEIRFIDTPGIAWRLDDIKAKALLGDADNDTITGYSSADTLSGGDGDDRLYGVDGDDALYGDAGNDRLDAGTGNDLLDGGMGRDYLYGGMGNDTYLFGRGDGIDTIYDEDTTANNFDVLIFKTGVTADEVQVTRDGNTLSLKIIGTSDQIKIERYFENDGKTSNWQVEEIRFTDDPNVVWQLDDIKAKALLGSKDNDTITGYATADIIVGGDGRDILYGRDGDDTLHGDAGDDVLYGENGNDLLLGGSGNDHIYGGSGNDQLIGSIGNDTMYAGDGNDTLEGGDGRDRLEGGAGSDLLLGGTGNDYLFGGNGDDILDAGEGDDGMYGEEGNDTYIFGRGDGQDIITDNDAIAGNLDKLVFKNDIQVADIEIARDGDNLILKIKGTADQVCISQYFNGGTAGRYHLEEIRFDSAPDTVWRWADINQKLLAAPANAATSSPRQASENIRPMAAVGGDVLTDVKPDTAIASATLQHSGIRRRWWDFLVKPPADTDAFRPALPPLEIGGGGQGPIKWPIYMPGYPSDWDKDDPTFAEATEETPAALFELHEQPAGVNSSELQSLIEAMAAYDTGSAMTSRNLLVEPVLQDMSNRHFQADTPRNGLQAG